MKTYQVNTYMTIIFKRFVESLQHDYTYLTIEFFSTNQVLSKDTYRILYMLNEYSFGFSAQLPPGRVSSDFDCYSTNISCDWRGKKLKSGESGENHQTQLLKSGDFLSGENQQNQEIWHAWLAVF